MSLEVRPCRWLLLSLHLLLHTCPPIFCILVQQIGGKEQLLLILAIHHSENLLTLAEPCIRFIKGGLASELCWLVAQKILHSWHPNWCDRRPRLCRYRWLHRIHHPVNRLRDVIRTTTPPPPVSNHSLDTPHHNCYKSIT